MTPATPAQPADAERAGWAEAQAINARLSQCRGWTISPPAVGFSDWAAVKGGLMLLGNSYSACVNGINRMEDAT